MNEPTEHEKQIAREAAATAAKRVEIPADGLPEHYYAKGYLAAITAAKQQQKEDATLTVPQLLEYLRAMPHNASWLATIADIEEIAPKALAARGVQPAAK